MLCINLAQGGYISIDPLPSGLENVITLSDNKGDVQCSNIDMLRILGNSDTSINKGNLNILGVGDNSIVRVYQADIAQVATTSYGNIIFYASAFSFDDNHVFRDFGDKTLKTELHQGNFSFIVPEPSTIILLGISGFILLRIKTRTN